MSENYLLYDPAAFGALEIKEDTREAEILRLRAENEKLRAILFQFAAYDESVGNAEMFTLTVPAGVIRAAAAALKETDNG